MADKKLTDIISLLKNVRQTGSGFTSRCPSHDDQKNSLSITETADGKILFKCFAGCEYKEIISALGISTGGNGHHHSKQIESIYDYTDEYGNLLYQNIRFSDKKFLQRHYDQNKREIWRLDGVRRVPYRLPELTALPAHYNFVLAEGEKDADRLKESGLIATNHKNWRAEFNYLLKGRQVVIFQDHDTAGIELAEKAAQMILRDAKAIRIVDCFANEPLPEKHGKDVSDYLETHTFDELRELISLQPDWKPGANSETSGAADESLFKVICLSDVLAEEINWLWKPYIPIGEFTIIEGIEGLGKSWIGCALACAVADGKKLPFSENEPIAPGNVLMLSAEDSLPHTVKPRLLSMRANTDRIFALDEVFALDNPKDLIRFEAVIAEYEPVLVIIDPLFSYTGGKNLNQESDSRPMARKLIAIAQKFDCAIVGVRHIGKAKGNGDARAAGLGSVAWRASARSVLIVGKDEETGEKALCQTKNNLAAESKIAVGFEIENGHFYWKSAPSQLTKEKMLAQPKDDETKAEQSEAVAFLREALRDGERLSKDIEKEAKEAGITSYATRKARNTLNVISVKKGGNYGGEQGWFMKLPDIEENESCSEDADIESNQHLQPNASDKTSYRNNLTEDVEVKENQPVQPKQTTSSNGYVPNVRMPIVCKCGVNGFVAENCPGCGEQIVPF